MIVAVAGGAGFLLGVLVGGAIGLRRGWRLGAASSLWGLE